LSLGRQVRLFISFFPYQPKHLFSGKRKAGKTNRR
jgi:hypothetical protein